MRGSAVENVGDLNASESRLRAMSHPVRRAMLRHYIETGPIAPVEVANALGVDLSKASYHSRILLELGFLSWSGPNRCAAAPNTSIGPLRGI